MMYDIDSVYISGPMRGYPDFNYGRFHDVEVVIRGDFPYLKVYNPALNFGGDQTLDLATYMKLDLQQVLASDALVFLPKWEDSEGAIMEARVGLATGKRFYAVVPHDNDWLFNQLASWEVEYAVTAYEENRRTEWRPLGTTVADYSSQWQANMEYITSAYGESSGAYGIPQVVTSEVEQSADSLIRSFDTGATRDTDDGKLDFEGFLSPTVLTAFAEYMHGHRIQSDGSLRDSDNWQKGMPFDVYMKSMWRHFMDVWMAHRGQAIEVPRLEALMALLFNVQGYAHELLKSIASGDE